LFSQANFGIVTKAGLWLMPQPDAFGCFICELDDDRKRPEAVDRLRRLALAGIMPANVHIGNDIIFAAQLVQYPWDLLDGQTYLSAEGRRKLRNRLLTPAWTVVGGLYGTAAQLKIARRAVSDALGGIGKLTFLDDGRVRLLGRITRIWKKSLHWPLLPGVFRRIFGSSLQKIEAIPHLYSIMKGEPGEFILGFAYFKDRKERPSVDLDPARDGAGMLWLAVLCPLTGTHTNDLLQLCEPVFNKHGFDLSVVFIVVNPRSTLALMEIFYDKQDAVEGQRALAL
jgi:4-cresol dehydrogenase (hydroxylating) flavoprotein subunit